MPQDTAPLLKFLYPNWAAGYLIGTIASLFSLIGLILWADPLQVSLATFQFGWTGLTGWDLVGITGAVLVCITGFSSVLTVIKWR